MTANLAEGRRLRDEGMAATESRRGADQDRLVIDRAIKHLADSGETFSANDVRRLLPVVAPQLIGSRFNAASRRGQIERVGSELADHGAGHARRLSTWRKAGGTPIVPQPRRERQPEPRPAPVLSPDGQATVSRAEYALTGSSGLRNMTEARAMIRQLLDELSAVTGVDAAPPTMF
jgi:hypothetical protein